MTDSGGQKHPLERDVAKKEARDQNAQACIVGPTAQDVLDSLSAHIALLDKRGRILAVNRAWKRFADLNNGDPDKLGTGVDYLHVCAASLSGEEDPYASVALDGLRKVLRGELKEFRLHYPCHAPTQERWFLMQATPLTDGSGIVVSHVDISERFQLTRLLLESTTRLQATQQGQYLRLHHQNKEVLRNLEQLRKYLDMADSNGEFPTPQTRLARLSLDRTFALLKEHPPKTDALGAGPALNPNGARHGLSMDAAPSTQRALQLQTQPRVLLAEDDDLTAFVLRTLLEQSGYQVTVVGDGPAALALLETQPFDIFLVDTQLPYLNGEDTARAVRKLFQPGSPRLPIIGLATSGMTLPAQGQDSPFDDWLPAPPDEHKLLVMLGRFLQSTA